MKAPLKQITRVLIAGSLPLLAGCGGGALAALGLGSLFGSAGTISLASAAALPAGANALAVIHNPEPATMLLLGSGMVAMAAFKKIKQ